MTASTLQMSWRSPSYSTMGLMASSALLIAAEEDLAK